MKAGCRSCFYFLPLWHGDQIRKICDQQYRYYALPRAFAATRSTSGLRAARVVPAVAAHFSTTRVAGKAVADLGAETGVHGREEAAAHGHEESFEEFTAR